MREYVFVLEQTLGHVAHAKNLERVAGADPDIDATFLKLAYGPRRAWERLPGLRSWSFRASWAARRGLTHHANTHRPHSIFIHTQVAGLLARRIMEDIPTVVSLDATPANFDRVGTAYSHRRSNALLEAGKRALNRREFIAAAALVTWCKWAADSLQSDYGISADKIRVIPPGVDTSVFSPVARDRSGPVRLLFVGGDFERKGGQDLLRAVEPLAGRVEVDIVTGGNQPIKAAGATVRVHRGLQPQCPELVRLYGEADVFVLPARGDCLPQAIAEAMSTGLPIVATNVGAITELVADGRTGLLVPAASPRCLTEALARLVSDRPLRQAMGRAGLEAARRDHDMVRNNRSILTLMSSVADARPRRRSVA
jgi:glycosyltransferase involved in cell wall biosynthesis